MAQHGGAGRTAARPPTRVPTRPRLRPGLPRAWRDPGTMQVGLAPTSGAVVAGLREGDDVVVAALDGTRTLVELRSLARQHGVEAERVDVIVRLLADAGLLVTQAPGHRSADRADLTRLSTASRRRLQPDADAWSVAYPGAGDGISLICARDRTHVRVAGEGRVAAALVTTLVCAGVGTVTLSDTQVVREGDVLPAGAGAGDVGASAAAALNRAVARVRPAESARSDRRPGVGGRPDLAVLVSDDVVDSRRGDELVRHDVPHLAVVASADRVVIGPLVLPGRTACLRCLDLHRRDRDPAWPQVVAQLLGSQSRPAHGRAETASATAAAGLAALQVLVHLDGHTTPVSVGRTLELALPDGLVERRAWRLHPSCGCARLPDATRVAARGAPA